MTSPEQASAPAPTPKNTSEAAEHHKPGCTRQWLAVRCYVIFVSVLLLIPGSNLPVLVWLMASVPLFASTFMALVMVSDAGNPLHCSGAGQVAIAGKLVRVDSAPEGTCSSCPAPILELYTSYQRAYFLPSDAFKVPDGGIWLTLETADEARSIVHVHIPDDDIWNSHLPNPCSVGYDPCWVTEDLRRLLHRFLPRFARAPLRIHVGDDVVIISFWVPSAEENVPGGYRGELNFTDAKRMLSPPLEFHSDDREMRPVGFGNVARGTVADLRRRRWKCLLYDEFGLVRCALIGTPVLFGLRELAAWLG